MMLGRQPSTLSTAFSAAVALACWGVLFAGRAAMAQELSPAIVDTLPATGHFVECEAGYMLPYTFQIPGTNVRFEMVPIPAVTPDRSPFWIGKYEVTFREYDEFQRLRNTFRVPKVVEKTTHIDAVTAPTEVYDPSRFHGADSPSHPICTMTLYSARQYTKWLSLLSDRPFRLPMESEWMAAASNTGPFALDDDAPLARFANFGNHHDNVLPVGRLRPNSWGLHDMQGNVSEWVLTKLSPRSGPIDIHEQAIDFGEKDISQWITKGGHFASPESECQIESRIAANEALWGEDPCIPASPNWLCSWEDSARIGFRIVRLPEKLNKAKMQRFWEPISTGFKRRVLLSVDSGKTPIGIVTPEMAKSVREEAAPREP